MKYWPFRLTQIAKHPRQRDTLGLENSKVGTEDKKKLFCNLLRHMQQGKRTSLHIHIIHIRGLDTCPAVLLQPFLNDYFCPVCRWPQAPTASTPVLPDVQGWRSRKRDVASLGNRTSFIIINVSVVAFTKKTGPTHCIILHTYFCMITESEQQRADCLWTLTGKIMHEHTRKSQIKA